MVMCGHFAHAYTQETGLETGFTRFPITAHGYYGVDLFFVLSGYLIGMQLWRELQRTGTIDYRRFILRRGLRIWPLFYAAYAFSLIALGAWRTTYGWSDPLFITNYYNRGIVLGSWSLCIEEQFYLLAPVLVYCASRRFWSLARYRYCLWGALVALPFVRMVTWFVCAPDFWNHDPKLYLQVIYFPLHTHCDGIIIGLLIASYRSDSSALHARTILSRWWIPVVSIALAVGLWKVHKTSFAFTGANIILGAAVLFLLESRVREWGIWRFLPFYWLSRLSYGMYLNHEWLQGWVVREVGPVFPFLSSSPTLHSLGVAFVFIVLSGAAALITYCAIEFPALQLRDRWLLLNHPAGSGSHSEGGPSTGRRTAIARDSISTKTPLAACDAKHTPTGKS